MHDNDPTYPEYVVFCMLNHCLPLTVSHNHSILIIVIIHATYILVALSPSFCVFFSSLYFQCLHLILAYINLIAAHVYHDLYIIISMKNHLRYANVLYIYLKGQSHENVCEIIALNDRLDPN
jgi:hypothetical protein